MSNIFNSFSQISTITNSTVFPVVENGLTRQATGQDLRQFVGQGEPGQGVPVGGAEGVLDCTPGAASGIPSVCNSSGPRSL